MKRIAHISLHGDPLEPLGSIEAGGQNVYVRNVAANLARSGVHVDVFTRWNNPQKQRVEEIASGARSIRLKGGPLSFVKKEKLLDFIDEMIGDFHQFANEEGLEYDLIHTHYYVEGEFGLRLARQLGVPHFHTFHSLGRIKLNHDQLQGTANTADYMERLEIEKRLMAQADILVATSPHEAQDFSDWYSHTNSNTTIIPCGLDPGLFRTRGRHHAREKLGLPLDKHIALYVGRLDPRKGLETLLFAYRELLFELGRKADDALLVIVGGKIGCTPPDPELSAFRKMAASLHLTEWDGERGNVLFAGSHPQEVVARYYSAADFSVVPSYYEPFGMVAIETQACGTPAIVSAVGGLRYAVEDRFGGLHAKPYSPSDLCDKMLHLIKDAEFCRRMGRLGKQRVLQKFTWNEVSRELYSEYTAALAARVRRPAANVITMATTPAAAPLYSKRSRVTQMAPHNQLGA
ncbi:MAG: glycosyltransferase [Candidatus Sumerlaeaceae bacterium]